MMTDPISDMLSRVRNAALARHESTRVPASSIKKAILELLKDEGYIADVREEEWGPQKRRTIFVTLKYGNGFDCAFKGIRRVSKPGRRVYVNHKDIPEVVSGLGVSILSTSQGVMTDRLAREKRVGGELLCEVW